MMRMWLFRCCWWHTMMVVAVLGASVADRTTSTNACGSSISPNNSEKCESSLLTTAPRASSPPLQSSRSLAIFDLSEHDFTGFYDSWQKAFSPESPLYRYDAREDPATAVQAIHHALAFVVPWLPRDLVTQLATFSFDTTATGPSSILIRGLPIDHAENIPATPTKLMVFSDTHYRSTIVPVAESWILGISRLLGVPIPPPKATGDRGGILRDLVPNTAVADRDLPMHRDYPRQAMKSFGHVEPDMLLLLAVRGDAAHQALTVVTDTRDLLDATSEEDQQLLRNNRIQVQLFHPNGTAFNHGDAFYAIEDEEGGATSTPTVTLFDLYDMQLTSPDSAPDGPKAIEAYRRLSQKAYDMGVRIDLQAGDLLILHNCRLVHGRTAFSPPPAATENDAHADAAAEQTLPQPRWLVKSYVSSRLWTTPNTAHNNHGSGSGTSTVFPNLNPGSWRTVESAA